jgi:hypothetical protein
MPVKLRAAKELRPKFSPEVLDLFRAIEKLPPRRRWDHPGTKELAKLLGLTSEYWTINFVNDVEGICHPPGCVANKDWATCRAVRWQLLAAAGLK